jgi:hemerythrin
MSLLTWDDSYSVGIRDVDAQHQWLVDIINALHEAVEQKKGPELEDLILDSLLQYTASHFAKEERLMQTYHYPDFESHKVKHNELARKVVEWQHAFRQEHIGLSQDMLYFLKQWLEAHEKETDLPMGVFLNSHGVR